MLENFKKYFQFPLIYDDILYVFDSNNKMVFQFEEEFPNNELRRCIVDILNGNYIKLLFIDQKEIKVEDSYIKLWNKYFISIRGWGYLTSPSCCNLDEIEAVKVQDEFIEYLIKSISKPHTLKDFKFVKDEVKKIK
jgi:hypothetical protein